jgi:hypothetical protein
VCLAQCALCISIRDRGFSTMIYFDNNTRRITTPGRGVRDSTLGRGEKLTVILRLPDNNPERSRERR